MQEQKLDSPPACLHHTRAGSRVFAYPNIRFIAEISLFSPFALLLSRHN
jgi:hypothetical protein